MKTLLRPFMFTIILLISYTSFGQNKNYELETTYMNCMYGIFEDNGAKLKDLIKKAEQKLVDAKLLKDTSGKSYLALFKNIEQAVDGRIGSLGISEHIVGNMSSNKKAKEYMSCMQGLMQSKNYENSKLNKLIKLSSSGSSNPKIKDLVDKLVTILEAKDFNNIFYKYLTFSLIDKFNASNKVNAGSSKGENE